MKLSLSKENVESLNALLSTATVTYGYTNWEGKRSVSYRGCASDLHFDKELKKWVLIYRNNIMNFRDFLSQINSGGNYKTQSKLLKELAKKYVDYNNKDKASEFIDYLNNLGQKSFKIADVKIYTDEVEWLKDHVTNITARFPSKYKKAFEKAFPGSEYTICDKSWDYAFTMFFDTMDGVPQSLLQINNSLGNQLDYERKRMCNTSYIWNLIKNYPGFDFGKRK